MCVLLSDFFKHLLLRKTDILKTFRRSKFPGNKIWRITLALNSKKVQGILVKIVYFGIIWAVFCLKFLLNCYVQEIKGFYQSFFGNEVDIMDIMNVSPNVLAKNYNFQKLRLAFLNERTLITRIFKTNSELSQNCREKQILLFKTTVNCLFNDIWC